MPIARPIMLHQPIPAAPHPVRRAGAGEVERLCAALSGRDLPPRTRRLLAASASKKARKLVEEAAEVALDAVQGDRAGVVAESVDLLYHLAVIWRDLGIDPDDIWAEMARRRGLLGLCEKLPKADRAARRRKKA
jgi:phosphoribosyl-ATP pyrophosphohydrolase